MNSVFSWLTGTSCFVYLDYIVIYTNSLTDHNFKLREVMDRPRLQPEKCEFLRKEVNYLGHQITEAGLKPELSDTHLGEGAENIFRVDKLYRRFLPNCSRIAFPLHKMLKRMLSLNGSRSRSTCSNT